MRKADWTAARNDGPHFAVHAEKEMVIIDLPGGGEAHMTTPEAIYLAHLLLKHALIAAAYVPPKTRRAR